MIPGIILRGNIYLIEDPRPHRTPKKRPVVVIQNNMANKLSSDIIVTLVRSNPKVAELPIGVKLSPGQTGLEHESYMDLGHIYTVNRNRLNNRIGSVPPTQMEKVNEAIKVSLSIS